MALLKIISAFILIFVLSGCGDRKDERVSKGHRDAIKIQCEDASNIKACGLEVRENFIEKYQLRELQLIPEQVDKAQQPTVEVQKFDSVDQIVVKQLQGVDSEVYDRNILTAIYNDLDVTN